MWGLLLLIAGASAVPVLPHAHYYLPQYDPNPIARKAEIKVNQAGFLYGPSLLGNMSYFPTGILGGALVESDIALFTADATPVEIAAVSEAQLAAIAVTEAGGLTDLASYANLYTGQWLVTEPNGPDVGSLTNYTQDLYFSMERLSSNAFAVKRLNPKVDTLPFTIDDTTAKNISTMTLKQLFVTGRLFIVDHSDQGEYAQFLQAGKYAAACTAYFYISPTNGQFLPLAIKTNTGANLTYTPLDTAEDWLLAKMIFNNNDFFNAQVYHLAATHAVNEIVYLAALRTLASAHPVRAYMQRIMYQAFSIRPVGTEVLFNPGGPFDQVFSVSSDAVFGWAGKHYHADAGLFQSNYLYKRLIERGLFDCSYGPPLSHFPFLSDVSGLLATIEAFTAKFVFSYYLTDAAVVADKELQAFVAEANGPAAVLDFPSSIRTMRSLIKVLSHMAYLGGIVHNALNINTPFSAVGVLPFHPASLYSPIPTAKGVTNILPWLPTLGPAITQIGLVTEFNRAPLTGTNKDLTNMFSFPNFTDGSNLLVTAAVSDFVAEMNALSALIEAKSFNAQGLAQGAPFLWKLLDPKAVPYYPAV